ncbi:MAG: FAD-dependent oxidoreductase [Planctomycetales bacterium]
MKHEGPVLILGAGINGCALARELLLNGVPVHLVDERDVGFGATAKSSRLIHGGLRYLEYGDLHLVRESLAERARLLAAAPQYVRPLRLFIPVRKRAGGILAAAVRFFGLERRPRLARWARGIAGRSPRGLWVVRLGLWLYDRLAGAAGIAPHAVARTGADERAPRVDPRKYRWLCSYADAQMEYPERFLIALLEDARRLAEEREVEFHVWTYHRAVLDAGRAEVRRSDEGISSAGLPPSAEFAPGVIVNATGAWGDFTLDELHVPSPPLFGGTKGSHLVTFHPVLRERLGDDGVYTETPDGRLVFVLPFGPAGTLVGTTDIPFPERPDRAVAEPDEIEYLLEAVNEVFDGVDLARGDVALHYSGVRPLPRSDAATPGGVSRDHWIVPGESAAGPVLTLVGGKLTTCRAFAEIAADAVLERLGQPRQADSRTRVVPGGENHPADARALRDEWDRLAESTGFSAEQVRAMWELWGTRTREIAAQISGQWSVDSGRTTNSRRLREPVHCPLPTVHCLSGTALPVAAARWAIGHEWVARLEDLVERRLLLVYHPGLSRATVRELAELLATGGRLNLARIDEAIERCVERLRSFYGRELSSASNHKSVASQNARA